jgi:pimeloyl-ACP methyl ester carboxylesterase
MHISVNGHSTYAYTGGKDFNPTLPTVVLIHGVLCDHSVWALQSRYLANHGWNVLAIDLPGHCRSAGAPPATVQEAALFIQALLDAQGLERVALVGHSFGSLIALQTAANLGERISHLVMVGTAYPMKVSPALLDASLNEPDKALQMINVFSRATLAPPSGAGSWVFGASLALGKRVLASNKTANVFHTGFNACNSYDQGLQAMAAVTCPILMVLGEADQMTTPKNAQPLIAQAKESGKHLQVTMIPNGHHQMSESPDATLDALVDFLHMPRR